MTTNSSKHFHKSQLVAMRDVMHEIINIRYSHAEETADYKTATHTFMTPIDDSKPFQTTIQGSYTSRHPEITITSTLPDSIRLRVGDTSDITFVNDLHFGIINELHNILPNLTDSESLSDAAADDEKLYYNFNSEYNEHAKEITTKLTFRQYDIGRVNYEGEYKNIRLDQGPILQTLNKEITKQLGEQVPRIVNGIQTDQHQLSSHSRWT